MREKFGRYAIEADIGSGSTATVYLASDGQERVALKVLHANLAMDSLIRERFRREVLAARDMRHPGIVAVHDFLQDGEDAAIVMEYCPGGSLEGWKPGGAQEIRQAGIQIAQALSYAHERGVVHRDLKPANILRAGDGSLKICDFGCARVQDLASVTASSAFFGEPLYVPPESLLRPYPDPRWDIYALGAILYRAALGKSHAPATLSALMDPNRQPPESGELEAFLGKALAGAILSFLGPAEFRPRTAKEAASLLSLPGPFASGSSPAASGSSPAASGSKPCLYCKAPMGLDSFICPSCREEEPDLRPYLGQGSQAVILNKLPEDAQALEHVIGLLRAVSGDPGLSPRFITEDARMYSLAERKRYTALPCLLFPPMREGSAQAVASLIEGRWTGKIRVRLMPGDRAARRHKKGAVIAPAARFTAERGPELEKLLAFERKAIASLAHANEEEREPSRLAESSRAAQLLRPADESQIAASARRSLESFLASGHGGENAPLAERLMDVVQRAGIVLSRMREAERGLDSVSLGGLYSSVKRMEALIESSDGVSATEELIQAKDKALGAYERYKETEIRRASLSHALLRAASRLNELATSPPQDPRGYLAAIDELGAELDRAARGP